MTNLTGDQALAIMNDGAAAGIAYRQDEHDGKCPWPLNTPQACIWTAGFYLGRE